MAKFNIYKLHFTTPVHFGDSRDDYGISLKITQSDTLYAAVVSCLAKLREKIPDDGDLGCSISSLFPFYQKDKNSKAVLFLPKPLKQSLPKLEDVGNAKKIKKVTWLDVRYFNKVINGDVLFEQETDIENTKKEYLTAEPIVEDFITSQVSPRVTVSRLGDEDAQPFYMDRVFFKDRSGLYFIVIGDTTLFEKGLKLLQYEGIGTDRNVGNGFFEFTEGTMEIELPESAAMSMSLSMFIPESKDQLGGMLQGEGVAYDFTRRGGWITTSPHNRLRKKFIHAFMPASVFSLPAKDICIYGKMVDLRPEITDEITHTQGLEKFQHPIWRNGKSIFIPIKI